MTSARQIVGAVGVTLGLGSAAVVTTQFDEQQAVYDVATADGRNRLMEQLERDLDPDTLNWAATPPPDGQWVTGDSASYLVFPDGLVKELDPETYTPTTEVDLGDVPGLATAVGGRLIVPMADGHVKVVDSGETVLDQPVGSPGDSIKVSLVGDSTVLVNRSAGEIRRFNVQSGEMGDVLRPELPRGELLVPSHLPGDQLWMFAGRSGHLVGVNLDSAEVQAVKVADHRADFLTPVALDEHVFLVDRSGGGSVLEVDPARPDSPVVHTEPLELTDTSRVDLVAQDGSVFVNDWGSNRAVIITNGDYRVIDKETDEELAEDLPAQPGAPPTGAPPGGETTPPSTDPPVSCGGDWLPCD